MEGRLLLKNCSVFRTGGPIRHQMAILVEGGIISRVAADDEIPVLPGDWAVSCEGRLVMPGLVDCHTHLVGGLLEPATLEAAAQSSGAMASCATRIEEVLRAVDVEALSAFAMASALLCGTTLLFEHLRCPRDVEASLRAQAAAARGLGVRLVNSHASSSRLGSVAGVSEVENNASYAAQPTDDAWVRPSIGFEAASSCDDALLMALSRATESAGVFVQGHLAGNPENPSAGPFPGATARLEELGLLGAGTLLSNTWGIEADDEERLLRSQTFVALNFSGQTQTAAEENGMDALLALPDRTGLGTGGWGTLWAELSAAFPHLRRLTRIRPGDAMAQMLIGGPSRLCERLYGAPAGQVEAGCLADLAVYNFIPPHEGESAAALMQLPHARVAWTIVGGRVAVREGVLLGHDFLALSREARRVIQLLRDRVGAPSGA